MPARRYVRKDGRPSRSELISAIQKAALDLSEIASRWQESVPPLLRSELLEGLRPLHRIMERLGLL